MIAVQPDVRLLLIVQAQHSRRMLAGMIDHEPPQRQHRQIPVRGDRFLRHPLLRVPEVDSVDVSHQLISQLALL